MDANSLTTRRLSETEFFASERSWQDLLHRTSGDPLFNSWHWATAWWRQVPHEIAAATELCIIVACDSRDRWVGLLPAYVIPVRRAGLRSRCLHLIGSGLPFGNLFRAEYRQWLLDAEHEAPILQALLSALSALKHWDEAIFSDVPLDSALSRSYRKSLPGRWFSREVDAGTGYGVTLASGFDHYLSELSGSARRQLFNKRKRLQQHGEVHVRDAGETPLAKLTAALNRFHRRRFNRDVVESSHLDFLAQLTTAGETTRPTAAHSLVEVDQQAVSAALDIDVGDRRYNIQLGIDDQFDKALSPGALHLGYAMQAAAAEGLTHYDFLIGAGLQDDYKPRFASTRRDVHTLHWVRSAPLRWLHRAYQVLAPLKAKWLRSS